MSSHRIGIDARKIRDFGIGRHLEGLLRALARRDDPERFVLFVHPDMKRDSLPADLPRVLDPSRFALAACDAPLYSLRELVAFAGAARRHGLDLLHFPHYVRSLAPGCPVTVTIHDAIHLQEPPSFAARVYARMMMAWAARTAAALFTVSDAARADLERLVPESRGKWRTIPNGIELSRFARPSDAALAAFRSARGLGGDFVLVVASHRPHKNLPAAVEAFERARRSSDVLAHAPLVLPARDDLEAARLEPFVAGAAGARIVTPVSDEDLVALYSTAFIVLVPSKREGFGLPGLEAMACGAPVLASPIAAHREVLGDAAAYAASPSAADLAAALADLAQDPLRRAALAAAGPARSAHFSWDEAARRTLEAWRSVLC